jgi:hypothetical protein
MKSYRCKECGTGYSTTGDVAPPSPNWDDGHVCEMIEVESKLGLFEPSRMNIDKVKSFNIAEKDEARMNIIGQNGNTGEHYE